MKALIYNEPNDVSVQEVPDAKIEQPTDVLVKVTATNICGSDLHMYEGRTDMETGRILGHENMGKVIEIGVAYGFADMGPYAGGQAELLRVPYGDFNCLRLGDDAHEKENDYIMLSDVFPTGYQVHDADGKEDMNMALNNLIQSVRFTGKIGIVGVYIPEDPGAADELSKKGKAVINFGLLWFKGITIGTGQAPVKKYNRMLRDMIAAGKAKPSFIVSHVLLLSEAADA